MPGVLRCDRIDLNQPPIVSNVIDALAAQAGDPSCWSDLDVSGRYYFTIPGLALPSTPGWYVICDENRRPLYAGSAEDLNARLNSKDGSRDNFANPQRAQDPVRNFIKAFRSSGLIPRLRVVFMTESSVCAKLGAQAPLTQLDHANIEKVLGLFRERILSKFQTVAV